MFIKWPSLLIIWSFMYIFVCFSMELITQIINFIYWYLKPLVKWFLRQTTRLCELQRVCYGEQTGAPRTLAVGMYRAPILDVLIYTSNTFYWILIFSSFFLGVVSVFLNEWTLSVRITLHFVHSFNDVLNLIVCETSPLHSIQYFISSCNKSDRKNYYRHWYFLSISSAVKESIF